MISRYILQGIGVLGALASIVVAVDAYVPTSFLSEWLRSSLQIPALALIAILGIMSMLLFTIGNRYYAHVHHHFIPSDATSVLDFVRDNRLLENIVRLDFYHYTAETVVTPWRSLLEDHTQTLSSRLLVRRPETDDKKQSLAEGCLNTVREIVQTNSNIKIDVRFYNHNPMLRLQLYYSGAEGKATTCLAGFYRYDPQQFMRFIGAERNTLLILKAERRFERNMIKALYSRFELKWNNSSSLRAVVFDMDGVLINSMGYHLYSWRQAFQSAGVQFSEDDLRRDVYQFEGRSPEDTVRELFVKYTNNSPTQDDVKKIVNEKSKCYLQLADKAEPFEGVMKILSFLQSRDVPLALVTGSPREAAYKTIERLFPGMFNVVITGNDVERAKPDPLPFNTALERLRILNHDECLVIENAPLGIRAAVLAGVPVYGLLVDSPIEPKQLEDLGARYVFPSHERLLQKISSLRFNELAVP